jgi:hypothetical protein
VPNRRSACLALTVAFRRSLARGDGRPIWGYDNNSPKRTLTVTWRTEEHATTVLTIDRWREMLMASDV